MDPINLIFKEIDFSSNDDLKKLDSIFRNWFSNPKTLNFVSPKTVYPFQMKEWIKKKYSERVNNVISITVSKKSWVVGFGSISIYEETAQLFHMIVDEKYRGLGIGFSILGELERIGMKKNQNTFTLNVQKKNQLAINFYKKFGYKKVKETSKFIKMNKTI